MMKQFNLMINNISKSFQRTVLKDVTFSMNNSDFIAVLGRSGSGKTTLMNIVGMIENYDQGQYYFNDVLIQNQNDYSKLRLEYIGFIFQSYHLIPNMSCRENILLPQLYAKTPPLIGQVVELAQKLGIEELLDQDVNTLSGGEKQRVAIARSLILDPGLLIADEPTGNLDPGNRDIIIQLLKKEHENGRGILLITHDMRVASIAETIYRLENGVLIKDE